MKCDAGNPLAKFLSGFFGFLGDPIGQIIKGIASAILGAAVTIFGDLSVSVPSLGAESSYQNINVETNWLVVYTAVASLLFASVRMALDRRGDAGFTALKGLLRVVLVAGGATTVITALADLSDSYSDHLYMQAGSKTIQGVGCGQNDVDPFLLLVVAFLLLLAAIVQVVLMYIRLGVLILLLGTLPLAAAASMTDWGGNWWRKHLNWLAAWLMYKPAAALVISAGATMIGTGNSDHEPKNAATVIAGIGVLLLAALALPALLKLVAPATAALGGGAGAGQLLSAGASLASGARSSSGPGGSFGAQAGGAPRSAPSGSVGSSATGRSSAPGTDSGTHGSGSPPRTDPAPRSAAARPDIGAAGVIGIAGGAARAAGDIVRSAVEGVGGDPGDPQ
ncbi:hypothetical protein V2S66_21270 [Streptomyces sp. V4-01]|uniref:TrbL/VirB6 plasmid conjugal transfer protein n=1 Tax=Actinacidiphila polyblastidii TaxID=3110430 RepID=A0ABU7PGX2_9ACTN|nr:hypothetical protein [Streptomyces sp. V4-01]